MQFSEIIAAIPGLTAFIVAFVVLSVAYASNVSGGRAGNQQFKKKAKLNGCVTKATAIFSHPEVDHLDKGYIEYIEHRRLKVTYEYFVDGISYTRKLVFRVAADYPQSMIVYYDPQNPRKCIFEGEPSRPLGCGTGIFLAMLTFVAVFALLKILLQFLFG